MRSNLRGMDEGGEKALGCFLDSRFYPYFTGGARRVTTPSLQFKGVDMLFDYKGTEVVCDEKAALHYVNKPLTTFAFELSFTNRGDKENPGWFVDDSKLTTHYLLCWVRKCDKDRAFSADDIKEVEAGLVDRNKLGRYFASLGWTKERLLEKARRIRGGDGGFGGDIKKMGYRFHYSGQLAEMPVNVIVDKPILKQCSDGWWFVRR